MDKITFLPRLQNERDKFELLLNRAGYLRKMTMKGASGPLSIKDMLADILSREQFISDRLNEILHGGSHSPCLMPAALEEFHKACGYPDYESPLVRKERVDHQVIQKYRNVGLDEIVTQDLTAYSNILAALEKMNRNQCLDHDVFFRVAEHTYKPYRRASAGIRAWLKAFTAESK